MSLKDQSQDSSNICQLHHAVWKNDCKKLEQYFDPSYAGLEVLKEELDPRGRTPLMLAVTLGNLEASKILLKNGCSAVAENKNGWTVVQEATATGNPELVSLVLESRDVQRLSSRLHGIPKLLSKLSEAPDFYVEMKWEFTSWVPLVSRMCPSDTYRVYKRGSYVRIDTTLLGFDQTQWERGNRSYIFKGTLDGAVMLEVDHDAKQVYQEVIQVVNPTDYSGHLKPLSSVVSQKLKSPVVTSYIDTDKISFERDKSGIWGWRNDRSEIVNGQECKVFSASNVELVTKTRTEHLSEEDKKNSCIPATPIQTFLSIAEIEEKQNTKIEQNIDVQNQEASSSCRFNPCNIQFEDYFDPNKELTEDIGVLKETTTKIQKFKGHLWLAENYPLKLQEQVMPIVDLMAISSSHFAKLKDFIQMQLPSGFPVKIEIPLFHVLTARITFGNIFGLDNEVPRVSTIKEDERLTCIIEDSIFEAPTSYSFIGANDGSSQRHHHRQMALDEDDALLQYAIQQSILESAGSIPLQTEDRIDVWEALKSSQKNDSGSSTNNVSSSPSRQSTPIHVPISNLEETQLQRAIEESLAMCLNVAPTHGDPQLALDNEALVPENDLALALSLSKKEQDEHERKRKEEEEMLIKILELSMTEK